MRGLDLFKNRFSRFSKNYILIGGTACTIAMEQSGLVFRATKDLDIVLCIEILEIAFVKAFWDFISEGGYQHLQKSSGKNLLYRFYSPKSPIFPYMLELFSRKPDIIPLRAGVHLTPIPINEDISSLSAILLNDDYYHFIHKGKQEIEGLSILAPTHLIPLKAKAWLDLSSQKDLGTPVDEADIRKHRNDIIRLYQLLSIDTRVYLPPSIQQDLQIFLERVQDTSIDLKPLGIKKENFSNILAILKQIYSL